MTISLRTHKMLWGRSANRCAICQRELVTNATETDDESIIGDTCHIVAKESNGPRGDSPLLSEQRDNYSNLILLCKVDHKLIDDQPNTYTVEKLHEIKAAHEKWVRDSLEFDPAKQHDDEIYATYIEEWARLADLENWIVWSSWVLSSGQPQLSVLQDKNLTKLRTWLLSRIWPKRYEKLEAAFQNFRRVLADFQNIFHCYVEPFGDDALRTVKFYRIPEWDPPRYHRLAKEYDFHVDLVIDLMLELTRAANYVCDMVRLYIAPNYRLNEGAILVESGPFMDMTWRKYCTEYRSDERELYPYPGLEKFKEIRTTRDINFGSGLSPEDPTSNED